MLISHYFNSGAFAAQNFEDTYKIKMVIRSCLQSSILWYLQDSITHLYSPTENQCHAVMLCIPFLTCSFINSHLYPTKQ